MDYDAYWKDIHDKKIAKKTAKAIKRKRRLESKRKRLIQRQGKSIYISNTRKSFEYYKLRKSTIEKAGGRCMLCGKPEDNLIMHHMTMAKDNPGKILDENNVLAICANCHAGIHPWLRANKA